jgi:hypothetical protein
MEAVQRSTPGARFHTGAMLDLHLLALAALGMYGTACVAGVAAPH